MRLQLFAILFALSVPLNGAWAADRPAPDVGETPAWERFKQIGIASLRSSLIDPDSAKVEWPYVAIGGSLKAPFGKRRTGFFTCGLVNAKNRMGGYTGTTFFLIMIRNGALVSLDIGGIDQIDTATVSCSDFVKKGMFPLVANIAVATPPNEPTLGFLIKAVPDGAYISSVNTGSPADAAGLVPGMVISAVNGIQLKGFDDSAIVRVVQATVGTIKLSIIGRGEVLLANK